MVNEDECGSMKTNEAGNTKGIIVKAGIAGNTDTAEKSLASVYHKV